MAVIGIKNNWKIFTKFNFYFKHYFCDFHRNIYLLLLGYLKTAKIKRQIRNFSVEQK